ncbi:Mss4-like protein [Aspergillus alliaceus]|uniref:Peptide-methionine (R)-S-oxide reductase n=2 Tax=Petromyces alliaceus TaxID=209559 RepID=A0A5N7CE02_PETAA|nr:Mss4-like protein [Aspergillus alliaceus]KAB8234908.1 Mss4-like protein [Aspergillus alliaceus]KAE8392169.1 Mss4-like protein [Aspergillus alliaceus]
MRIQRLSTTLRTLTSSINHHPTPLTKPASRPQLLPLQSTSFSTTTISKMSYPDQRTTDEWRAILSPEQFRILREKGTERPGTGEYDSHYPSQGIYSCAGCNAPLYKASHKFKSGCGWPAYFDSIPGAVTRHTDRSLGMERTEIVCSKCGGHLGHVFKGEGYATPTDERHCVNSVSLRFKEGEDGEGAKAKA